MGLERRMGLGQDRKERERQFRFQFRFQSQSQSQFQFQLLPGSWRLKKGVEPVSWLSLRGQGS